MSEIVVDSESQKVENIKSGHPLLTDTAMRQNNFDLLRFMFAFVVFLVHVSVLTRVDDLQFLIKYL